MGPKNETVGMAFHSEDIPKVLWFLNESRSIYCTNRPLVYMQEKESRTICTVFKNDLYYIINIYFSMSE